MPSIRKGVLAVALACATAEAGASCGAAFCLVNTDWSVQGAWTEPGARFDLRYEAVDLDQPRHGRDRIGVGEIPRHHDEVETRNRNLVGIVDWGLSPAWGVTVSVPYVDRDHTHMHNHHGTKLLETWSFREVGDVRVLARYEFLREASDPAAPRTAGITLGLKLPSGKHDVKNAEGEEAERTLQPGTGTTDLVLGAHWHGAALLADWSWFAQVQGVVPLNEREGFKPGNQVQMDGGVRYAIRDVAVMLQLNYHAKGRDSGINAEPEDSGQRAVYFSPGISWNLGRRAQIYAFAQLPLHQAVNGVQLTADYSFLVGISSRF